MKSLRLFRLSLLVLLVSGATGYLLWSQPETAEQRARRTLAFQETVSQAAPLVAAIQAFHDATGEPPQALTELIPGYLPALPVTGLDGCESFEYRRLPNPRSLVVWYDLGALQDPADSGQSRYSDGDPGHAILVFTLDGEAKISSASIDRAPKDIEVVEFDSARWKAGEQRMQMAPSLAETWRLYGMPRSVFEDLLGQVDGTRAVHRSPWELRVNCPTGLLRPDALVYWPTEAYPQQLYGGLTEPVGSWVYVRN